MKLWGYFCLASLLLTVSGAFAQEYSTNSVASNTDWVVFVEEEPKQCWVVSAPKEIVNTRDGRVVSARRGDIRLWVSFWAESEAQGEVSFTGGYPYEDNSQVKVEIGSTSFLMYTEGERAWALSPEDDAQIIAAMKRGAEAVVTGLSSRGTTTQDTFSLLGFTASVADAEARCES